MSTASPTINRVSDALAQLFKRHRIVVWSDQTEEFHEELDTVSVAAVTILRVQNNEFGLKHRILRDEPKKKFLIYRAGEPPADRENWLLDVELAHATFSGDRTSLMAQEVGLPAGSESLAAEHAEFFSTAPRRAALSGMISEQDSPDAIRLKMLAVIAGGSDPSLDGLLRELLQAAADGTPDKAELIEKCQLAEFLWHSVSEEFGYRSETPTIEDFSLWLFEQSLAPLAQPGEGSSDDHRAAAAAAFFRAWQDSLKFSGAFRSLSRSAEKALNVRHRVKDRDFREILGMDTFEAFDRHIVTALAHEVADQTVTMAQVSDWVRERRRSSWVRNPGGSGPGLDHRYQAIAAAAEFLSGMSSFTGSIDSFDDGLAKYASTWFRIDQSYRRFTLHNREAENPASLETLRAKIEKFYANKFLRPLGDAWQQQVQATRSWRTLSTRSQREFFKGHVAPVLKSGRKKVVVIISDGLRYEAAEELRRRIRQQDRYDADLEHMLGSLPSYTQLGMAALLPNTTLEIGDNALVRVDGKSAAGTENRNAILAEHDGRAVQAEELIAMGRDEARDLLKSSQVVYVYHNRIDKTGDNPTSEKRVLQATEETFDEIISLLKKLTNANANRILITADHGFLYQDTKLNDSEFISEPPAGEQILFKSSRFVLGRGLVPGNSFTRFTAPELGLSGDMEALVPNSIGRLRRQGSGTRYVHGGAALQEVVIPVITVSKKRHSDVRQVDVELAVKSSTISTSQLAVELYQSEPVTDKVHPRALRVGLYAGGEPISERPVHTFDLTAADPRERSVTVKLLLTRAADDHDGEQVELRLESPVPKTSHYTRYAGATYQLRRSFTPDFDF